MSLTKFPNGLSSFLVDDQATNVTVSLTPTINTDSGKTYMVGADGITITLPGIAVGNVFTIVNTAPNGAAGTVIQPAAVDAITNNGASVDNAPVTNTKATSKNGDFITLASLNGVVAWQVIDKRGIWA